MQNAGRCKQVSFVSTHTSGYANLTRAHSVRESMIKAVLQGPSPSDGAKAMKKTQEKLPILNGRPHHGLPIGLYNPVFDQFKADLSCTEDRPITAEQYSQVAGLFATSRELYEREPDRRDEVCQRLNALFGAPISIVVHPKRYTQSDGLVTTACGIVNAIRAVLELKNEIGYGGSDPSFQGCLSYRMYWAEQTVSFHTISSSHFDVVRLINRVS
jgi:hypothetical protein